MLSKAFYHAMSGRPGPVALALPEDMLRDMTSVGDADHYKTVRPGVDPDEMASLQDLLGQAQRPLMIVGGGGWNQKACDDIVAYAEANNLPTAASFRCQDLFDNNHPNYVGELGTSVSNALAKQVEDADLLLVVGARLGEMTTKGYTIVQVPRPKQKIAHIYPDPDEIGRVYQADLAIAAGVDKFAASARKSTVVASPAWGDWAATGRKAYLDNLKPSLDHPGAVDMWAIMQEIAAKAPDAVITSDAGNFAGWPQRFWQYSRFRTQVAPTNGSMGYGVPSAIGARLVSPDHPVIGFAGDGGFMMAAQEFATAAQYGVDPIIIVVNNSMYGTIRAHQERNYPERVVATALTNPDFVKWAESFGAYGAVVEKTEDFAAAFDGALKAGRISLIEIKLDQQVISTNATLNQVREAGLANQS